MKRGFEKIPEAQFKKDVGDMTLYTSYSLPRRTSQKAAGYDFFLLQDITLQPGESLKIPTGIRAKMEPDEVLFVIIRHSLAFKHNIQLINQTGVVDADYYEAENFGHIFIFVKNESQEEFTLKAGEAIAQGIFTKFLITDDDNPQKRHRIGA